ncbi:unnamed protein product [Oppiella nova]|uniref:Protein kinase domain-containing protein n=1 Tax=Oppiella nova TaxID=334625 RepID=A0A7R9LJS4_9ACAR|nr:unnamed protein product [Oppiella nova]CAG2164318.1 unnamed protein product [Oppiella nova]
MEYAECGNLFNLLHGDEYWVPYTMSQALSWVYQCARGVAYLHSMQPKPVVHRNLKSPKWMAPEVFRGTTYNEKCDVYSWGIILWEVLARRLPYDRLERMETILWAVHRNKRPFLLQGCPSVIENLMTICWSPELALRPSMDDVVKILKRFMSNLNLDLPHLPLRPISEFNLDAKQSPGTAHSPQGKHPVESMSSFDKAMQNIQPSDVQLGQVVGRGAYGDVYRGVWNGNTVAVKQVKTINASHYDAELAQLSQLIHPNIVLLLATARDNISQWLIMEFTECGSLHHELYASEIPVPYTMIQALSWLYQCARGVSYMHSMLPNPVVHRDLKPQKTRVRSSAMTRSNSTSSASCGSNSSSSNRSNSTSYSRSDSRSQSQCGSTNKLQLLVGVHHQYYFHHWVPHYFQLQLRIQCQFQLDRQLHVLSQSQLQIQIQMWLHLKHLVQF